MRIDLINIDLTKFKKEVQSKTDIDYDRLLEIIKVVGRIEDNVWTLSDAACYECDSELGTFIDFLEEINYFKIEDILYDCAISRVNINAFLKTLMNAWEKKLNLK